MTRMIAMIGSNRKEQTKRKIVKPNQLQKIKEQDDSLLYSDDKSNIRSNLDRIEKIIDDLRQHIPRETHE